MAFPTPILLARLPIPALSIALEGSIIETSFCQLVCPALSFAREPKLNSYFCMPFSDPLQDRI